MSLRIKLIFFIYKFIWRDKELKTNTCLYEFIAVFIFNSVYNHTEDLIFRESSNKLYVV